MKKLLPLSIAFAFLFSQSAASAIGSCFACGAWGTWGERIQVCAAPSEGLLTAMIDCMRRPEADPAGGCAAACAGWLAGYDACAASGDPDCFPSGGTLSCDLCLASSPPYATGCTAYKDPCSYDATECVPCASWASGSWNPNLICWYSIGAAIDLSSCACSGACANKCGSGCALGYLDPPFATPACTQCLQDSKHGCATPYAACGAI